MEWSKDPKGARPKRRRRTKAEIRRDRERQEEKAAEIASKYSRGEQMGLF